VDVLVVLVLEGCLPCLDSLGRLQCESDRMNVGCLFQNHNVT